MDARALLLVLHESSFDLKDGIFPFMSLPLEIRLHIYTYLLPPRTHKIVTQIPQSCYFYSSAAVSTQSYPFGLVPPPNTQIYKILTSTFHSFPWPSISPQILRVSKQVKEEAEPILYGGKDVEWDFGIHLQAFQAFWRDRSELARRSIRNISIAREIYCSENHDGKAIKSPDEKWLVFCRYLHEKLPNLRHVELTIWSSSGDISLFPIVPALTQLLEHSGRDSEPSKKRETAELQRWRNWEWTHDLLQLKELQTAKIRCWGFQDAREEIEKKSFDSWLAGRMVGDRVLRDRMIKNGLVLEKSVFFCL
jgi:hypothetical protein